MTKYPILAFFAGIFVCAAIVGAVYFVLQDSNEKEELKNKIAELEELINENETEKNEEMQNVEENNESVESTVNEIVYPEDTFASDADGNFSGRLTISGYPKTKTVPQSFCFPGTENCGEFDYVSFEITDSYSNALMHYFEEQKGNSFIGENWVGIGCKENEILSYYNFSEANGMKEYFLDMDSSEKLFAANAENPITITLEKLPLYTGSGAPDCYSHFTEITVY